MNAVANRIELLGVAAEASGAAGLSAGLVLVGSVALGASIGPAALGAAVVGAGGAWLVANFRRRSAKATELHCTSSASADDEAPHPPATPSYKVLSVSDLKKVILATAAESNETRRAMLSTMQVVFELAERRSSEDSRVRADEALKQAMAILQNPSPVPDEQLDLFYARQRDKLRPGPRKTSARTPLAAAKVRKSD